MHEQNQVVSGKPGTCPVPGMWEKRYWGTLEKWNRSFCVSVHFARTMLPMARLQSTLHHWKPMKTNIHSSKSILDLNIIWRSYRPTAFNNIDSISDAIAHLRSPPLKAYTHEFWNVKLHYFIYGLICDISVTFTSIQLVQKSSPPSKSPMILSHDSSGNYQLTCGQFSIVTFGWPFVSNHYWAAVIIYWVSYCYC